MRLCNFFPFGNDWMCILGHGHDGGHILAHGDDQDRWIPEGSFVRLQRT